MTVEPLIAAPADTTAVPVTPPVEAVAPAVSAPAAPARPDGLPDAYWDDVAGIKPEAFSRLAELEAAEAARKAGVPEAPDKYELKVSDDIVGLDGKPVEFDPTDPLVAGVLPVLHEIGVSQEGFSKLLGVYAALEVAAAKEGAASVAAEQAKLGANHKERTAALHGQVIAAVGAEAAEKIRQSMTTADAVIALEQLVSKVTGTPIGAAPPAPRGPSYDETIANLPVDQRLAAARALKAG